MSDADETARRHAEERDYLFDMLAQLARLASGCGEESVALILAALIPRPAGDTVAANKIIAR